MIFDLLKSYMFGLNLRADGVTFKEVGKEITTLLTAILILYVFSEVKR